MAILRRPKAEAVNHAHWLMGADWLRIWIQKWDDHFSRMVPLLKLKTTLRARAQQPAEVGQR
jgi:hypothetical protein